MPKVMTSASESISRPKSLTVLVMRAMRPSRPSSTTATPMALAATSKCGLRPSCPAGAEQGAFDGADDGDESEEDVAGGEQRGQRVGGAAGRREGERGSKNRCLKVSLRHLRPALRRARMLEPPETRSPGFTLISHSGPRKTSTREPNLMSPTRSPLATGSPSFL